LSAVGYWLLAFSSWLLDFGFFADCRLLTADFYFTPGKFKKDATGKDLPYSVKSCEQRKLLRVGGIT